MVDAAPAPETLALRELTRALAASHDELTTLELAVRSARRLLSAAYASIWLIDERSDLTRSVTCGDTSADVRLERLPMDSLAGRAVATGQPILVSDAADHPAWRDHHFIERTGLRAYLAVPLLRAGAKLGVLEVMRPSEQPFSASGADTLTGLANAAAIAVASARAFADMQAMTAVVASTPDAVIAFGLDGRIRGWNAGAEHLYGWTASEAVGAHLDMLVPDELRGEFEERMVRLRDGEPSQQHETVRLRKNGERVDIAVSIAPITDAAGRIIGAGGISHDITERKRVEAMLRRREQEFSALVEHAPDAIARLDRNARFVYANPAVERLSGLAAELMCGKTMAELGVPEAAAVAWEIALRQVFASAREVTTELPLPTPNGERNLQARLAPELSADGSVEYVLCIARDITERTRADEERTSLYRELLSQQQRLHQLTEQVLLRQGTAVRSNFEPTTGPSLTARELSVLHLLVRGRSNPAIGRELHISSATVKTHVAALLTKLDVTDRTQAAVRAISLGLAQAP